jgi:hypothetical protein
MTTSLKESRSRDRALAAALRARIAPRVIVAVLLAALAAAVVVVLAMAILGEYTKLRGRLLLTASTLAWFSLVALGPSLLRQRGPYPAVAAAGLFSSLLGFLLVTGGTWATPNSDDFWKAAAIVSVLAVSLSYVCWTLLLRSRAMAVRAASRAAVAAASLSALLAGLAIILEVRSTAFWWAFTVIIIVQFTAGLVALALSWLGGRSAPIGPANASTPSLKGMEPPGPGRPLG